MKAGFWVIEYKSCEGNERWVIARCPYDWQQYDVESAIQLGGCGDDPAYIIDIWETYEQGYGCDFT